MNKLNLKLWFVSGIATATVAALLIVQFGILNRSIETNRQIFRQKLDILSREIGDTFRRTEHAPEQLPQWVREGGNNMPAVTEIIDAVLERNNLPVAYQYGIYAHAKNGSGKFDLVKGTTPEAHIDLEECPPGAARDFAITSLTCGQHFGEDNKYHLAIFFTGENGYILSQAGGSIVVSLLLLLLLSAVVAFLLYMLRRQKRISEIKTDFINNLTHEFKTPIFSIDLAASIIRKSKAGQEDERTLGFVNLISAETERLRTQVDKVLQMALVDSGNFRLERRQIDLHEVIRHVIKHFELIIQERKGRIVLRLEATSSTIFADDVHLKNVLNNLIDNAVKYNANSPVITLSTQDVEGGVAFSVSDNGVGMNPSIQQQIFQKFFRAQTGDVHDVKGFGLGLSYVKQIIDAHKGTIDLKSSVNAGSEFRIYLPSA